MFSPMSIGDYAKIAIAAIISGAICLLIGTWHGKSIGRAEAAAIAAENSVRILKQRGKIDEQVNSADAAALCGSLGLSDADKDECVRRLRQANTQP